jgi:hypothetical protein
MKYRTEYLFDNPRAVYEPELSMLCKARIRDARYLLKKLSKLRDTLPSGEERDALMERYQAVEEALRRWETISEEE